MLTALHIQDFVLIDQASLVIETGLTALTGETGAGKSILLDALGLAVGGRVERGAIRTGAERGVVSAAFEPRADHDVWALLSENDLQTEDEAVILRRVLTANGKSRAFINDQPVSIALLRTVGQSLLEIHGQHDGHGFLSAATHRALLDEFGGLAAKTEGVEKLYRAWRGAQDALAEREAARAKTLAEADYLRHVVAELEKLAPVEDEEQALVARRGLLMASEKISAEFAAALSLLGDEGLEDKLAASARRLLRASETIGEANPALDRAIERMDAAISEVMEARSAVEDAAAALEFDAAALEEAEERLFALRAAARKHGVPAAGLPAFFQKARAALCDLDDGEANFETLKAAAAQAEKAYFAAAEKLSAARRAAAGRLDKAVAKELAPLKLGSAAFATAIDTDTDHPRADGIDSVEFMVATNKGAKPGPLKSIASGGELSRFVLAMKAALAAQENRTVIIFDEVDAGVGGAVADAVGERLARLARDAQVMVVTHSPQVAARADSHWRISKSEGKSSTTTAVRVLGATERIEEIARMLSGARVSEAARDAARALLEAPRAPAKAKPRRRASR